MREQVKQALEEFNTAMASAGEDGPSMFNVLLQFKTDVEAALAEQPGELPPLTLERAAKPGEWVSANGRRFTLRDYAVPPVVLSGLGMQLENLRRNKLAATLNGREGDILNRAVQSIVHTEALIKAATDDKLRMDYIDSLDCGFDYIGDPSSVLSMGEFRGYCGERLGEEGYETARQAIDILRAPK